MTGGCEKQRQQSVRIVVDNGSLCLASHCLTLTLYLLFGALTGSVSRCALLVMRCSHTHYNHTIPLS